MKHKFNKIVALTIVALFLGAGITQAQGLFGGESEKANTEQNDNPGLFRDGNPFDEGGSDGPDDGPGGNDKETPIGEGIIILGLLSGAYALIKRNVKKRNEN